MKDKLTPLLHLFERSNQTSWSFQANLKLLLQFLKTPFLYLSHSSSNVAFKIANLWVQPHPCLKPSSSINSIPKISTPVLLAVLKSTTMHYTWRPCSPKSQSPERAFPNLKFLRFARSQRRISECT